ncbi:MAG: shikimate kinase [Bacteroidota bacterium]
MDNKRSQRIFLTGFMGSGKSTIGPILANTLGYDFIDIDKAIEKQTGKSVREIFHSHGEGYFRTLERALLQDLRAKDHRVISLGGGTISDPISFPIIRESGILVYLKTAPDQLFKRLHHKTDRPVLMDSSGERLSEEALRTRIEELYARRQQFYEQADIIIPTDEHKLGITVDQIVKRLSEFLD